MTEREKMLAGQPYDPSDEELVRDRQRARRVLRHYSESREDEPFERTRLLRKLFGSCGEKIVIEPVFHCDYGKNIHVGENFYANFGLVMLDCAEIRVGDNCLVGPHVGFYAATHSVDPKVRLSGLEEAHPIAIGNNCWIGGHAVINPGVVLGDNTVVAAGAVVTRSFPQGNVVLAGVPARVVKEIPVEDP